MRAWTPIRDLFPLADKICDFLIMCHDDGVKWKSRISRLGLIWIGVGLVLLVTGALLQWLNFNTHNGYRQAGIWIEPGATAMLGFTGLVNGHEVRRGRSLAERP
jgi:hypothetical protein